MSYNTSTNCFEEAVPSKSKMKTKSSTKQPKVHRTLTQFFLFKQEKKKEFKGMNSKQINVNLAKLWKELDTKSKSKYKRMQNKMKKVLW